MPHRPQWPAAAQVEALLQHPVMEAPPQCTPSEDPPSPDFWVDWSMLLAAPEY